jgi:hypothetical protein
MLRFAQAAVVAAAGVLLLLSVSGCKPEAADAAAVAAGMKAKLKLPVQVDDDTRLDDVRALSPKELGYFMTLTKMTKAQADAAAVAKPLEANLRGNACKDTNYTKFFKAGIALRITYQSQDGPEVASIVMLPKDCGY